MAKVNNSTAQNKWDSLKGSAGVSLSHIVQGKASSSDFQRVQNVLSQQSSLASQIFSQAVSTAEKQAQKFQASYKSVLDKDNKELLSAFEVAMNAELQKVTPDLVGQLKEIIEMSVTSSNEELDKSIGSKFDEFKEFLPKEKNVPSMHDILAANAQQAAEIHSDALVRWERQEPALLEKIAGVFQSTLRNLAETINREKAQRAQRGHSGQLALAGPSGHDGAGAEARPSVLARGMSLVHGASGAEAVAGGAHATGESAQGSGGSSTMVVALNPAAQRELTTAAAAQKDFYTRVKSLLPSTAKGASGGDAEEEGKESKKADTWWRSFKNWFGDDDKKNKKNDKFSWVKTLGTMLALMILNPKLFKTIGDGLKNLLTWDNLKAAAETSWDWVKGMASSVMEGIANLLGGTMNTPTQAEATAAKDGGKDLATTDDRLKNLTPKQQNDLRNKKKDESFTDRIGLTGGATGGSEGFNSVGANWLNKGLSMVGVNTPAMKSYNMEHTDTNVKSPTYGHIIVDDVDKGKNPDFKPSSSVSTGSGRSSIKPPLPQTMPTGSNASTTFSESPSVKYSPGVSLPSGDSSQAAGGPASMQPQKGAPQIGIGSFGFNAANSDNLTLMNTTHFTGG